MKKSVILALLTLPATQVTFAESTFTPVPSNPQVVYVVKNDENQSNQRPSVNITNQNNSRLKWIALGAAVGAVGGFFIGVGAILGAIFRR